VLHSEHGKRKLQQTPRSKIEKKRIKRGTRKHLQINRIGFEQNANETPNKQRQRAKKKKRIVKSYACHSVKSPFACRQDATVVSFPKPELAAMSPSKVTPMMVLMMMIMMMMMRMLGIASQ